MPPARHKHLRRRLLGNLTLCKLIHLVIQCLLQKEKNCSAKETSKCKRLADCPSTSTRLATAPSLQGIEGFVAFLQLLTRLSRKLPAQV